MTTYAYLYISLFIYINYSYIYLSISRRLSFASSPSLSFSILFLHYKINTTTFNKISLGIIILYLLKSINWLSEAGFEVILSPFSQTTEDQGRIKSKHAFFSIICRKTLSTACCINVILCPRKKKKFSI